MCIRKTYMIAKKASGAIRLGSIRTFKNLRSLKAYVEHLKRTKFHISKYGDNGYSIWQVSDDYKPLLDVELTKDLGLR